MGGSLGNMKVELGKTCFLLSKFDKSIGKRVWKILQYNVDIVIDLTKYTYHGYFVDNAAATKAMTKLSILYNCNENHR